MTVINLAERIQLREIKEQRSIEEAPAYPIHPQCRCTKAPIVRSWQELGLTDKETPQWAKNALDGKAPRTQTYNDWLKGQEEKAPGFARDMLGPTRYGLWKDGKLKLSDMAKSNRILTVDQLRKKMGLKKK